MTITLRASMLAISVVSLSSIASAHTQGQAATSGPSAQASESDNNGLADIVVTAQRRSESAQKVPIAIQAIDATKLTQSNATSKSDLSTLVPSVVLGRTGQGESV